MFQVGKCPQLRLLKRQLKQLAVSQKWPHPDSFEEARRRLHQVAVWTRNKWQTARVKQLDDLSSPPPVSAAASVGISLRALPHDESDGEVDDLINPEESDDGSAEAGVETEGESSDAGVESSRLSTSFEVPWPASGPSTRTIACSSGAPAASSASTYASVAPAMLVADALSSASSSASSDSSESEDESDLSKWTWAHKLNPRCTLHVDLRKKGIIDESQHAVVRNGDLRFTYVRGADPVSTQVAVKMVRLPESKEARRKVEADLDKEAMILMRMDKAFVVDIKHHGKEKLKLPNLVGRFYFLIMARMEQNLAQWLVETPDLKFNYDQLAAMVLQLLSAYNACHSRVEDGSGQPSPLYHRDVKPQNILVANMRPGEDVRRLVLCDFAFSTLVERSESSRFHSTFVGTIEEKHQRYWVAPEVNVSEQQRSYKLGPADVWALGAVLYFLGTQGKALFRSREEVQRAPQMKRDNLHLSHPLLVHLIGLMTPIHPEKRWLIASAAKHPAGWSQREVLRFLIDLSQQEQAGNKKVEAILGFLTKADDFPNDWPTHPRLKQWFEDVLDHSAWGGAARLLREIRNVHEHVVEVCNSSLMELNPVLNKLAVDVIFAVPEVVVNSWTLCLSGNASAFTRGPHGLAFNFPA